MNKKGLIFETILGFGTIFFIVMIFFLLAWPLDTAVDTFKNVTPSTVFNYTVNQTTINNNYDLAYNFYYFSLFFIVIIIVLWIIKKAQQKSKRGYYD